MQDFNLELNLVSRRCPAGSFTGVKGRRTNKESVSKDWSRKRERIVDNLSDLVLGGTIGVVTVGSRGLLRDFI
jgi:hypothetical protein